MLDAMYIGAAGMQAQQTNVEVISNNLANVNTASFKKGKVSFEDLLYRDSLRPVSSGIAGAQATGRVGLGVAVASTGKVFTDGELKQSESPLDVAIRGRGFFEVVMPDGSAAYTRAGNFQVNADGFLSTADGYLLRPSIQIPADATNVVIDTTGKVSVSLPGEKTRTDVGQIEMAVFANPGGLTALGGNLYTTSERSGDPAIGHGGDQGFGTLSQGFTEASNVKLVDEMISLVVAQRAYEVNAKVIQAADEMLGMSNNLRR